MHFKINKTEISLLDNQLIINSENIQVNQKTYDALRFLLESDNQVVEKNALIKKVWQGIVVSDDSLFKQIQLVRQILIKAGLPEDSIENVYGKGYRFKYPIENAPMAVKAKMSPEKSYKIYVWPLALIILLSGLWFFSMQEPKPDQLDAEERKSIHNLMLQDWKEGLLNIEQILSTKDQIYSKSDLAYLYSQKGVAENQLQKMQNSFDSLNKALKLNTELNDFEMMGKNHLNLAKYYDFNENRLKQMDHIEQSIKYFTQAEAATSIIDAQMELAYLQKKAGDIELSINTYQNIIAKAKSIGDKTGEMIAINNLAATYLIINENDQALKLAEQGLALNLSIGNGQHIANSYSFLSQLYQQQSKSSQAISMIEQALKYQLTSGDFRNMGPKLMSLNFLMVQTFQYQQAEELLEITGRYAQALKVKNGLAILNLYTGMNAAHQNQWKKAEKDLMLAYQLSEKNNFKYRQNQTIAYLALAHYFNDNHLQSIEPALKVASDESSNARPKAMAALVLAFTYHHIERQSLFDEWYAKAKNEIKAEWLFENILLLKLTLLIEEDGEVAEQIKAEIQSIQMKMTKLATESQVNQNIYKDLKTKVTEHVDGLNESLHSIE